MMKILVLSDSHSGLNFMRECIRKTKPDAVVHLGDYLEDGRTMEEEFPQLPFFMVPGNCDRTRFTMGVPPVLVREVCGVKLFMTHGHLQGVKITRDPLIESARAAGAAAALYGHTHVPDCRLLSDDMWLINPGTCSSSGGTCALIFTDAGQITKAWILDRSDLEAME